MPACADLTTDPPNGEASRTLFDRSTNLSHPSQAYNGHRFGPESKHRQIPAVWCPGIQVGLAPLAIGSKFRRLTYVYCSRTLCACFDAYVLYSWGATVQLKPNLLVTPNQVDADKIRHKRGIYDVGPSDPLSTKMGWKVRGHMCHQIEPRAMGYYMAVSRTDVSFQWLGFQLASIGSGRGVTTIAVETCSPHFEVMGTVCALLGRICLEVSRNSVGTRGLNRDTMPPASTCLSTGALKLSHSQTLPHSLSISTHDLEGPSSLV
ncbi:hypothetical protein QBC40DRAFT_348144 [Triangularia verruculosa]|uniref:Uncharacterized protein n=1 Tax=Triangularia verruculosa TaxID=2587418 RepID=A0AAN6XKB2_9PEZI|nr:hypothetical protein QBC40DRAFT_348144 [Triangularia verruculosa]